MQTARPITTTDDGTTVLLPTGHTHPVSTYTDLANRYLAVTTGIIYLNGTMIYRDDDVEIGLVSDGPHSIVFDRGVINIAWVTGPDDTACLIVSDL